MNRKYIFLRRIIYLILGSFDRARRHSIQNLFVLCYHGISNDDWTYSVNLADFKRQIQYLLSKGYEFITMAKLLSYLEGHYEIKKPSVILTFDDGYKDILPVRAFLKTNKIKPTLFILADTKRANIKELENKRDFLNSNDLKLLLKNGWEIGSHTTTHSDMYKLSNKDIGKEIKGSKRKIEKDLNIKVDYIAYPKGRYNNRVLSSTQDCGYKLGLTMDDGKIYRDMNQFLIPRIGVDRTHSFEEFKTLFSPSVVFFRKIIKQSSIFLKI